MTLVWSILVALGYGAASPSKSHEIILLAAHSKSRRKNSRFSSTLLLITFLKLLAQFVTVDMWASRSDNYRIFHPINNVSINFN